MIAGQGLRAQGGVGGGRLGVADRARAQEVSLAPRLLRGRPAVGRTRWGWGEGGRIREEREPPTLPLPPRRILEKDSTLVEMLSAVLAAVYCYRLSYSAPATPRPLTAAGPAEGWAGYRAGAGRGGAGRGGRRVPRRSGREGAAGILLARPYSLGQGSRAGGLACIPTPTLEHDARRRRRRSAGVPEGRENCVICVRGQSEGEFSPRCAVSRERMARAARAGQGRAG